MTTLLRDRTLRTAASPDPARWTTLSLTTSPEPLEANGVIDFSPTIVAAGKHVLARTPVSLDQGLVGANVKTGTTGTTRYRYWLSHSAALVAGTGELATNGYYAQVTHLGALSIGKVVANTETPIGTAIAGKIANAVETLIRFERTAGRVRVRAWAASVAEPSTWDFDVADDGTVPAGLAGFSQYRVATTTNFTVGKLSVYTPAGGIPALDRPKLLRRIDGSRIPFGRASQTYNDDVSVDTPAFLTGTTTRDAVNGLRTVAAAAGATAGVTLPPSAGEAVVLTVHNLRLSSDTDAGVIMRVTDGTTVVDFKQSTADATALLTVGATTIPVPYIIRSLNDGPRHRTLTLVVAPAVNQVIVLEGTLERGSVLAWATLPGTVTRNSALTASLSVVAGSAGQSLAYTGLSLETQRL